MHSRSIPRKSHSLLGNGVIVKMFVFVLSCMITVPGMADSSHVREARLARLRELNASGERDIHVTNAVLATLWPPEMRKEATKELHVAIQSLAKNEQLNASAVCYFVESNDSAPLSLIPYLHQAISRSEAGEKYYLLRAICQIGPQCKELREAVEEELGHPNYVIALQAAAALLRIDSGHVKAMSTLKSGLRSESEAELWRSADSMGRCGVKDAESVARLKQLLSHPDVRVRAAVAIAFWKLTQDVDATIPVLRDSLAEKDVPLPIGFISPSSPGESHRAYIVRNMSNMRRKGAPVLTDMLGVMENNSIAGDTRDNERNRTAMTALIAIAASGPVSEVEMNMIRSVAERKGSVFHRDTEEAEAIIKEIKVRPVPKTDRARNEADKTQ